MRPPGGTAVASRDGTPSLTWPSGALLRTKPTLNQRESKRIVATGSDTLWVGRPVAGTQRVLQGPS